MKNIITLLLLLLGTVLTLSAQAPSKFRYQAVARDAAGALIVGVIEVRLTFVEGGPSGTVRYSETHTVNTTQLGAFDLTVGEGTPGSGSFNDINWKSHSYYLKVDLNPNPGVSGFLPMGTSQLLSVPYALYALESGNDVSFIGGDGISIQGDVITNTGDLSSTNEIQTLTLSNGNQLSISNGNSVTLPSGSMPDNWGTQTVQTGTTLSGNGTVANPLGVATNSINASHIQDGSISASDLASGVIPNYTAGAGIQINGTTISNSGDTDNDPDNELQTLAKTGNIVTLSNNGGSFTDEVNDADADPNNEKQTLSLSGNTLSLSLNGGNIDLPQQTLSLNNNVLTISGSNSAVTLPSGGTTDNWGTQTVQTAATLTGNGTAGSPLGVATNAINSSHIQDGSISASDLAGGVIPNYTAGTGIQINGNTISNNGDTNAADDLTQGTNFSGDVSGTFNNLQISAGAVGNTELANGAISGDKIATMGASNGQVLQWNGGAWVPGTVSSGSSPDNWGTQTVQTAATLTGNGTAVNPLGVANNAINGSHIQDGSISASDLAGGVIPNYTAGTGIQINGNTINNTGDADNSATNELQSLTLNGNQLAISGANSITLPSGGTADNWGTQTVQTAATLTGNGTAGSPLGVAANAINGSHIQDGSISASDLAGGVIPNYTAGTGIQINGNTINNTGDGDNSATNELQSLTLNGNQLSISGANSITLPSGGTSDNWGTQTVQTAATLTGDGTVANPLGVATNSINSLHILNGSIQAADLAAGVVPNYTAGNGIQINGSTISASDNSASNELQTLQLSGSTLSILPNGNSVNLSGIGGGGVGGSGTTNFLPKWSNSTTLTNSIVKEDNNSIGIGVASPLYKLHVNGGSIFYGPGTGDGIRITRSGGLRIEGQGGDFTVHTQVNDLLLNPGNSDGNVGIGTTNPAHKLHVVGSRMRLSAFSNINKYIEMRTDGSDLDVQANGGRLFLVALGGNNIIMNPDNGSVGIGTITPTSRLHVTGNSSGAFFQMELQETEANDFARMKMSSSTNHNWQFAARSNSVLAQNEFNIYHSHGGNIISIQPKSAFGTGGYVGINTTTNETYDLHVNGSAAKPGTNTWTSISDARLKTNVHNYTDGLAALQKIRPVWFTYTGEADMPKETVVGIIAQELQAVAPYMVGKWTYIHPETKKKAEYLSVDNGAMTYITINAIKEQQQQIETLKQENIKLAAQNESLRSALENQMAALRAEIEAIKTASGSSNR